MAVSEAILVCLSEKPMSGYDLAKTFDASIGFFWRASHQQIYRELGKLRDKGFVQSQEIEQAGKPNRIVHTLTDAGRQHIRQWSTKPSRFPSIKDELLVKFYGLQDVYIDSLKDHLTIRVEQHETRLKKYLRIKDRYYEGKELNLNQKGKLMALEMGIKEEEARINWFQELMQKLGDL